MLGMASSIGYASPQASHRKLPSTISSPSSLVTVRVSSPLHTGQAKMSISSFFINGVLSQLAERRHRLNYREIGACPKVNSNSTFSRSEIKKTMIPNMTTEL